MDSFFGIGIFELFMIAVIALVVLGPERLPGAMREVAKYARQLRDVSNEFQSQFSEELKVLDEINPRKIISSAMDPATPPAKPPTTTAAPAQPAKTAQPPKPAPAAKPLQPAAPTAVAAATAPVANGDAGNTILPPKAATPSEVADTPDPAPVVEDVPTVPPTPDSSVQPAPDSGPAPEESR